MAAKKTAKKTAKKDSSKAESTPAGVFNILDAPVGMANSVGKTMKAALERRKGREVNFTTQSELMVDKLPLRALYLQWALNNRGIHKGVTNIVARDRFGKSSLVYNLLGGFMQGGHPCGVLYCEGKPLEMGWAKRCLSPSQVLATKMVDRLHVMQSSLLAEMAEMVECWCKTLRDPTLDSYIPHSVAIVLAADPIGRLATNAQAAGISAFDGMDKQKQVDVADKGHSWDRARWLHEWVDKLLLLQKQYNMHLIAVEHQNEANVAGGGAQAPSFIPQYTKDLGHRTKRGGQAINQIANLQLTVAEKGFVYSAGEKVARRMIMTPYKNSYGPENRTCCFALKLEPGEDTEDFLDPGLRWDYTEVEWLADNGYLGFRKTGSSLPQERFSSDALKFTQLSLVEAAQAWREADASFQEELAHSLKISGFLKVHESVMGELESE